MESIIAQFPSMTLRGPSIHEAAREGNSRGVYEILYEGVHPDTKDHEGNTALVIATQKGHDMVVNLLLAYNADVNLPSSAGGGVYPIHAAIFARDAKMLDLLLAHGAKVDVYTPSGLAPLHVAAYVGSEQIVRALIKKGADPNAEVSAVAGKGETALHMAVASWNEELLPVLLKSGAKVDAAGQNPPGQTALHIAAEYGNLEALQTLLDWGADIKRPLADGRTALHKAVTTDRYFMVKRLLKEGLDPLTESKQGESAVCGAAARGFIKILDLMLESCKDALTPALKAKLLISAAGGGQLSATARLIAKGYDVNQADAHGIRPIQIAVYFSKTAIVQLLLHKGATDGIQDCIDSLSRRGDSEMLRMLRASHRPGSERPPLPTMPSAVPQDQIIHAIAMDMSFQMKRRIVANPMPGGLKSCCQVCHDLNFRRGISSNEEVVHTIPSSLMTWSLSQGCASCTLIADCLERLTAAYKGKLQAWTRRAPTDIYLFSAKKGSPLFLQWRQGNTSNPLHSTTSSCRIELFTQPGSPSRYQTIGEARQIEPAGWSERRRLQTVQWLKECMDGHSRCKYEVTSLPTRVIDVGSEEIEPRLYVTNGEKEKYVTMSHCWGGKCPVMTTTETIEDHKQGLPMNLLPKTFREAIIVTRSLGIRYLWIDSLCIIQNSKEDWEAEALRMSDVYANCYLMIAADASSNCEGGCFPDEGGSRNPGEPKTLSLPCPVGGGRTTQVYFRLTNTRDKNQDEVCHHLYEPLFEHRRSPLNKRGWTLQERILAPRALHCGKYEIAWECADRIACECQMVETAVDKEFRFKERFLNPMKDAGQPSPASIAGNTWLWVNIVEEFTRRSLTRYTDTLPALSGLAQRMCPSPANQYVCGIWRNHFVKYLNWEANYDRIPDVTQMPASLPRRNEGFDIPTWSWASIVGPIRFPGLPSTFGPDGKVQFKLNRGEMHWDETDPVWKNEQDHELCHVQSIHCVTNQRNPFGPPLSATLILRGFAATVTCAAKQMARKVAVPHSDTLVVSFGAANERKATVSFVGDVADQYNEVRGGDKLTLLFLSQSATSEEGMRKLPNGDFEGLARIPKGRGLVLRPIPFAKKYRRVGAFSYEGKENWEMWSRLRYMEELELV